MQGSNYHSEYLDFRRSIPFTPGSIPDNMDSKLGNESADAAAMAKFGGIKQNLPSWCGRGQGNSSEPIFTPPTKHFCE